MNVGEDLQYALKSESFYFFRKEILMFSQLGSNFVQIYQR